MFIVTIARICPTLRRSFSGVSLKARDARRLVELEVHSCGVGISTLRNYVFLVAR